MVKKNSHKLDKITIFWSSVGALLILIFLSSSYFAAEPGDRVKLVIDYGDGSSRNFVTTHHQGITAWDMLQQANAVYDVPLEVEDHFRPKSIGDKENGEDGKRWNFYLNGRLQSGSPFEFLLSGGEVILFKFE